MKANAWQGLAGLDKDRENSPRSDMARVFQLVARGPYLDYQGDGEVRSSTVFQSYAAAQGRIENMREKLRDASHLLGALDPERATITIVVLEVVG